MCKTKLKAWVNRSCSVCGKHRISYFTERPRGPTDSYEAMRVRLTQRIVEKKYTCGICKSIIKESHND